MTDSTHPNLSIMTRLDIKNLDACMDIFADNFVWHYINPKLPDIEGDYQGVAGLKNFFSKLGAIGNGVFEVKPVDIRTIGDELVFVQVCNQLALNNRPIEFDAVVIWRIVGGKIAEAWDIPAVHTVRAVQPINA